MNIINIISSNSHYIEIQYNNLLKNIKNEFRYIVMNNALFNSHEFQNIKLICEKLNIEHIEVKKNLEVERFTGRTLYNQNSWIDNGPTPAATYALNYLSIIVSQELKGHICLIHSDMFFLNQVDLKELIGDYDMMFVPQYRGNIKYIWDGFCIFSEKVKMKELNWMFSEVNGQITDCGGHTYYYLLNNSHKVKYIESWNISDYKNGNFDTHLNGNIRYSFSNNFDFKLLGGSRLSPEKSFEYETPQENYEQYYSDKFKKIIKYLISKDVQLPNPYWIDVLMPQDTNEFLIIHYKSGSNYLSFQNANYNELKLKELKKLV